MPYYDDEKWKKAIDEAVEKERKKMKIIRSLAILIIIFTIIFFITLFFFRDAILAWSLSGAGVLGSSAGIISKAKEGIGLISDATSVYINVGQITEQIINKQEESSK